MRILKIETDSRKIALTLRDSAEEEQVDESYEPRSQYEKDGTMTLGDIVGNIFGGSGSTADDEDEI